MKKAKLEGEIDRLQEERDELWFRVRELEVDNTKLQTKMTVIGVDNTRLRGTEAGACREEVDQLLQDVEGFQEERSDLLARVTELVTDNARLRAERADVLVKAEIAVAAQSRSMADGKRISKELKRIDQVLNLVQFAL